MTRFFQSIGVALGLLALSAVASHGAENIQLKTELSQSVLAEAEDGRVYLRVALEGLELDTDTVRTPANVVLVLDQSGSMRGDRMEQAREAALMATELLNQDDVLGVVSYSDNAHVRVAAGELSDPDEARDIIGELRANGRTALHAGVSLGLREISEFTDPYKVNRIILLSDGLANVGPSSPRELADLGRKAAKDGVSVTTIGLGLGYSEDLMTQLALASDGNHAFVEEPADLVNIFNQEFGDVLAAIGGDVKIIITCPEGFSPVRVLGREAGITGNKVVLKLNQLYARQEKYVLVELKVDGARAQGEATAAAVDVNYTDLRSKARRSLANDVTLRFSNAQTDVEQGVNQTVRASVLTQVAAEISEEAVALRDAGEIEGAQKLLRDNAADLSEAAKSLPPQEADRLKSISSRQRKDAENLNERDWTRTRKLMREHQYKSRNQQRY